MYKVFLLSVMVWNCLSPYCSLYIPKSIIFPLYDMLLAHENGTYGIAVWSFITSVENEPIFLI